MNNKVSWDNILDVFIFFNQMQITIQLNNIDNQLDATITVY